MENKIEEIVKIIKELTSYDKCIKENELKSLSIPKEIVESIKSLSSIEFNELLNKDFKNIECNCNYNSIKECDFQKSIKDLLIEIKKMKNFYYSKRNDCILSYIDINHPMKKNPNWNKLKINRADFSDIELVVVKEINEETVLYQSIKYNVQSFHDEKIPYTLYERCNL